MVHQYRSPSCRVISHRTLGFWGGCLPQCSSLHAKLQSILGKRHKGSRMWGWDKAGCARNLQESSLGAESIATLSQRIPPLLLSVKGISKEPANERSMWTLPSLQPANGRSTYVMGSLCSVGPPSCQLFTPQEVNQFSQWAEGTVTVQTWVDGVNIKTFLLVTHFDIARSHSQLGSPWQVRHGGNGIWFAILKDVFNAIWVANMEGTGKWLLD